MRPEAQPYVLASMRALGEGGQADDGGRLAGQVQCAAGAVGRLGHEAGRQDQRNDADRQVDEEDALPAEVSTMVPPMSGPMARARPETPAHMPMA